jgi:hypothetical protein
MRNKDQFHAENAVTATFFSPQYFYTIFKPGALEKNTEQ